MRRNLPVTGREYVVASGQTLVSVTDLKSRIRHCNRAFVEVSGFSHDELIGQPHNMIRHPDMPQEAFRDMWETIQAGKPWTALVKNRRKNGDHYWVRANVTPIMENGTPTGYLSVRTVPGRDEVRAAEELYAQMRAEAEAGSAHVVLREGFLRATGLRGQMQGLRRAMAGQWRLGLLLAYAALVSAGSALGGIWAAAGAAVLGGAAIAWLLRQGAEAPLLRAIEFANTLAAGDLTRRALADRDNLEGRLLRALNQLGVNLYAVVSDARSEVDGMLTAAAEIAQGNTDLSARTENTASSLEETAATMDQLASSARNSSDTVQRCAETAQRTLQRVTATGASVGAMTDAMGGIAESSGNIARMIELINQITFQTNLLALNAAVEAARAGDAGRGFAVVAGEVRQLASRTAAASNEIRDLVQAATRNIDLGTERAAHAGEAMGEVRSSIVEMNDLVQGIRKVVDEEMHGIGQVNEAVTQIDHLTQQNAAMVEQIAAAAQGLREQARNVQDSMSVFRLR